MKMLPIIFVTILIFPGISFADNDRLREQFNKLDDNNDRMLSRAELLAKPDLVRFSNFYPQGSFRIADINEDNKIDFREFEANEEIISAE